ncbi:Histidinol-phosphate aminotransferase [Candidatus Hodgkinia cicadicola]|nr:Histidinol-phosphate aminotransferase [Candidatus Hodgkinia cicadicola]
MARVNTKAQVAKAHKLEQENLASGNSSDKFFHPACSTVLSAGDRSTICKRWGFSPPRLYKSKILASGATSATIKQTDGKPQDIIRALEQAWDYNSPHNPTNTFLTLKELQLVKNATTNPNSVINRRWHNNSKTVHQKTIITRVYGPAAIRATEQTPIANISSPLSMLTTLRKLRKRRQQTIRLTAARLQNFNLFWKTKITWAFERKKPPMRLNYSPANFAVINAPKKAPMSLTAQYFEANGAALKQIEDHRLFKCIRTSLGPANANNVLTNSTKQHRQHENKTNKQQQQGPQSKRHPTLVCPQWAEQNLKLSDRFRTQS